MTSVVEFYKAFKRLHLFHKYFHHSIQLRIVIKIISANILILIYKLVNPFFILSINIFVNKNISAHNDCGLYKNVVLHTSRNNL
jgi:hypothetical protein